MVTVFKTIYSYYTCIVLKIMFFLIRLALFWRWLFVLKVALFRYFDISNELFFKALSNFAGDSKEYPLLPPNDSCPTSPRSRSPQSIRSNSQLSDYSNGHPERLMSPEDDDDHSDEESEESERSLSTPPHPGAPHPLEQSPHAVYLRPSPFEQCNSKSPPNHQHMPPA